MAGATVEAGYRTDAWGKVRGNTGSTVNRRIYTGHEHDIETGLVYMGARFYDSEVGMFVSPDPMRGANPGDPRMWNAYRYAFNNPAMYVDPTGQLEEIKRAQTWLRDWRNDMLAADLTSQ